MSAQSMLDQLLRQGLSLLQGQGQGQPQGVPGQHRPATPPAQAHRPGGGRPGTDWGTFGAGAASGAAATGALGLLLGSKQARRYAGKAVKYGGIAAIGLMAYKAYQHWQAQNGASAGAGAAPGATPAPLQPAPQALPAPTPAVFATTVDRLDGAPAETHSRAMLVAMVAAAKADGHLDARERSLLDAELGRLAGDHALRQWLDTELQRPLDPAQVAQAAQGDPALAAEMYLASLLVADDQSFMERAYLEELARQLGLAPGLKAQLEAQAAEA
jgi:uncharacterized membrane protein YebE (DUF533 family)